MFVCAEMLLTNNKNKRPARNLLLAKTTDRDRKSILKKRYGIAKRRK